MNEALSSRVYLDLLLYENFGLVFSVHVPEYNINGLRFNQGDNELASIANERRVLFNCDIEWCCSGKE